MTIYCDCDNEFLKNCNSCNIKYLNQDNEYFNYERKKETET